MFLVGLTGGIGSGKTTVAGLLAERGAVVIDADRLARDVVAAGTPGFDAVVGRFGADVIGDDGELDRGRLAAIVFNDATALADLNAIVHPLVGQRIADELARLASSDRLVVLDVPLLVEASAERPYRAVVVVTAPEEMRVQRLVARGLAAEDARARIAAQASDAERLRAATHVVDNSGSLEALRLEIDRLHSELTALAATP